MSSQPGHGPPPLSPVSRPPTRPIHLAPSQQGSCRKSHPQAPFHRCTNKGHGRASRKWAEVSTAPHKAPS